MSILSLKSMELNLTSLEFIQSSTAFSFEAYVTGSEDLSSCRVLLPTTFLWVLGGGPPLAGEGPGAGSYSNSAAGTNSFGCFLRYLIRVLTFSFSLCVRDVMTPLVWTHFLTVSSVMGYHIFCHSCSRRV